MMPLNLSLNKVDTSMPQPVDGKYVATVDKVEVLENKEKSGYNLKVTVKLQEDVADTKGGTIKSGFAMSRYLPLPLENTKYDGEHKESFQRSLALFQLAVCGKKNTPENVAALPDLDDSFVAESVGRSVIVSVSQSKQKDGEDSEYGPRAEIKSFLPVIE